MPSTLLPQPGGTPTSRCALRARGAIAWALGMASLLTCSTSLADPSYYLVTVYDNEGETNLSFRYWTVES